MTQSENQKVLVVGLSYPTYHLTPVEGPTIQVLLESNNELRRIHTVPDWYYEQTHIPKYQWATAQIQPYDEDGRLESAVFGSDTFEFGEIIPYEDTATRRSYLDKSPYLCISVAEFQRRWQEEGTSLAIVRPKAITDIYLQPTSTEEHGRWQQVEKTVGNDRNSEITRVKHTLACSEVNFMVKWVSQADEAYEMPLRQWGLHVLYQSMKDVPGREQKVLTRMKQELDLEERDVYLFLGAHQGDTFAFDLLDTYRPKKAA